MAMSNLFALAQEPSDEDIKNGGKLCTHGNSIPSMSTTRGTKKELNECYQDLHA